MTTTTTVAAVANRLHPNGRVISEVSLRRSRPSTVATYVKLHPNFPGSPWGGYRGPPAGERRARAFLVGRLNLTRTVARRGPYALLPPIVRPADHILSAAAVERVVGKEGDLNRSPPPGNSTSVCVTVVGIPRGRATLDRAQRDAVGLLHGSLCRSDCR